LFSMNPVLELCCLSGVSGLFEEKSSAGPHKIAVIRKAKTEEGKVLFMESVLRYANIRICTIG
jgi:hypothetical protein